jgi:hypothetical protein
MLLRIVKKSKKKHLLILKVTLSNFEILHFFIISGDVPKMALAIYMRGDKKS